MARLAQQAGRDATRQAILDTAQELFARFGPVKTSVADIARALGMSPANIYNFFPSRDAILEAAGDAQIASLRRLVCAEMAHCDDEWERIRLLFLATERLLRDCLENEKDILQLEAISRSHHWTFISSLDAFLRGQVAAALQRGIAAGAFRALEPTAAADALFSCMIAAIEPVLICKFKRAEHARQLCAQLDLLEHAVRVQPHAQNGAATGQAAPSPPRDSDPPPPTANG